MAGAGEVLEKARELYIKMGEATRTLAQAAGAAEQDYQRLREHTHLTIAALTTLRADVEWIVRNWHWLAVVLIGLGAFSGLIGGMLIALTCT